MAISRSFTFAASHWLGCGCTSARWRSFVCACCNAAGKIGFSTRLLPWHEYFLQLIVSTASQGGLLSPLIGAEPLCKALFNCLHACAWLRKLARLAGKQQQEQRLRNNERPIVLLALSVSVRVRVRVWRTCQTQAPVCLQIDQSKTRLLSLSRRHSPLELELELEKFEQNSLTLTGAAANCLLILVLFLFLQRRTGEFF